MPVPPLRPAAALLAVLCLLPAGAATAQADALAPALAAAFAACLAPESSRAERMGMLAAAGWAPLAPGDEGAAAAALAPGDLVVRQGRFLIRETHDPEAEAEYLDRAIRRLTLELARLRDSGEVWRAPPGLEATLELRGDSGQGLCVVAAAVTPEVMATALDLPLMPRPARNPALTLTELGAAPATADRILHLSFAPDAFAGREVMPLIYTPAVRMPD